MDIEQLASWTGSIDQRVYRLEESYATAVDAVPYEDTIDRRILEWEERAYQMIGSVVAQHAKAILLGLNEAFRDHFENGDFEISEEEFIQIISRSQRRVDTDDCH